MPEMRLIPPDELVQQTKPKREIKREAREQTVQDYVQQLSEADVGFGGVVELEDGDNKRKLRVLLKEAAERLGLTLRFRPIKDPRRIEFLIEDRTSVNGDGQGR